MIIVKKKGIIVDILQEANLCETSPVLKEPVPEVGTLEDSNESDCPPVVVATRKLYDSNAKGGRNTLTEFERISLL